MTNEELFKLYDNDLVLRLHNVKNLSDTRKMLTKFKEYLSAYPPSPELAKGFLAQYINRKPRTLYRYAQMIKVFMKWYGEPMDDLKVKIPKTLPPYTKDSDIEKLFSAIENKRSHKGCIVRDSLLVELALKTGLRRSELGNLEVKDVHQDFLVVRNGKGGKDRIIPLSATIASRLQNFTKGLKPDEKVFSQAPSTATMDGDRGLGFVVGYRAMMEVMRQAEKAGAGFIAVRNSTHFGAGAGYAMMALERDMIGIAMTNTGVGVVAPGSTKGAVGTNPLAVAAPADKKPPFVLDMAISVVADGKFEIAQREGTSIPEGWAIDNEGKSITDPAKRLRGEGGLLPLGGTPTLGSYKGFGLGVLVEILCGVLSGSCACILRTPGIRSVDHFFGALRIDSFLPVENFKKSMDEMIEAFEALPKLPGVKKIYAAGGYEAEIEKDRKVNGIPLHSKVIEELKELAKELDIEYGL